MIKIRELVKVESLEEAWELNQKRTNKILGGMLWLRLGNRNVQKAIDLSGLGLDQIEETEEAFSIGCMATLRPVSYTHLSMIGYADMLRSREMTEEERMDAANYIFKEGKRLEALSFKLLDLMVLRHQELVKRRVSTEWLAKEIRGILEPALEKQEIRLWVSVEDRQVELEPDLMKTVLMNLLDNGRKAMEGSGRETVSYTHLAVWYSAFDCRRKRRR